MDASGATDERATLRTAKSCGPDAPTLASSSWEVGFLGARVARKPGHPGERGISRKTIACGNAGCPGELVVTNARAYYSPRAAAGATGARHSPLPAWGSATPFVSGRKIPAQLGRITPREREGVSYRHCEERSDEAIRSFFTWRNGLLRCARNDGLRTPCTLAV